MAPPLSVLVCGAGPSGLAAAIALAARGHRVRVFERLPEMRRCPHRAGSLLYPSGVQALDRIAPGLLARVARDAMPISRVRIRSAYATRELALGAGGRPAALLVHSDALQTALLEAADGLDVAITRNTRVKEWFAIADGGPPARLRVFLDRARTPELVSGDLIVGADGLRSVLAEQVPLPYLLRYRQYAAWDGIAEGGAGRAPEPGILHFDYGAGYSAVTAGLGDGRVYWQLTHRTWDGPEFDDRDPAARRSGLFSALAGPNAPSHACAIAPLAQATPDIRCEAAYDKTPRPETLAGGRECLTLVGSAAHHAAPFLHFNLTQGLRDAADLAAATDLGRSDDLRRFEAAQRARAATTARFARAMALAVHATGIRGHLVAAALPLVQHVVEMRYSAVV